MIASSPRLYWLYLAILAPLVLLAIMAWAGSRAELKAAWTDAREQAERITRKAALEISEELSSATIDLPAYADPPVPGISSEFDALLDSTEISSLLSLRDNPDAGTSPAGLPRRVLAALRIHTLDPEVQSSEEILALLTKEEPSILTARAMVLFNFSTSIVAHWEQSEEARRLFKSLAEPPTEGIKVSSKERVWWLRSDGETASYIAPDRFAQILTSEQSDLPPWATLSLVESDNEPSGDGLLLASSEVPLGAQLQLHADTSLFTRNIRQRQRWLWGLLSVSFLTAIVALITIHRTVSRERQLAELKSQFVASVSHELRAPLGSIRLMAEALQQGRTRKPAEFHNLIAREGARLSHLVENVLDFARIEEGRKRYHSEECDLKALISDTLELMTPLAQERKVAIHAELTELTATLDPAAIQQALINLLDNALKFTPEGTTVTVATDSQPTPRIMITDEGPGIPVKDQIVIFNRFHRLGNELRREAQGTGIGLSIVKHIAEAHGGSITVDSTPPHGATFTLILSSESCES